MRASWSLRTEPLETFTGGTKLLPPSCETAMKIGEWPLNPVKCAHGT